MRGEAEKEWEGWRAERERSVSGPYGPLALTGTYWLADYPDGRIEGVPGLWTAHGDEVLLRLGAADGVTVDGETLVGDVHLGVDADPQSARVAEGERRFLVMRREGEWAVRVFDPEAAARRAFAGIEVFDFAEGWVLTGRFWPYAAERTVLVTNVDGQDRGLGIGGELSFSVAGEEYALQVAIAGGGSLWGVLADATSGVESYRFRFLQTPAPDAEGNVTVDFNRTLLPPCAFADHFICPFPPPGNTLPFALRAGERNLVGQ